MAAAPPSGQDQPPRQELTGWGRFPRVATRLLHPSDRTEAQRALPDWPSLIARGNGRAYGDAAINPQAAMSLLGCERILSFDPASGEIICEAGLLLADLLRFAIPRGFFPPVVPGTAQVSIGGMVAADVHGKNHHNAGSFGRHVSAIRLLAADGAVLECSRAVRTDLFAATLGGMGLSGIILDVGFRLRPLPSRWMRQELRLAPDLSESLAGLAAGDSWQYSVAWIDAQAHGPRQGRAVIQCADHATAAEAPPPPPSPRRLPGLALDAPGWLLNRHLVNGFNALHWARARPGISFQPLEAFFFPLDALPGWNRLYGRAGFAQYQCVLPPDAAQPGLRALLDRLAESRVAAPLAVLKLFGAAGEGLLSFPRRGATLALDMPISRASLDLMEEFDAIVADHGGRLYLAKDSRSGPAMMARTYPLLDRFRAVRDAADPHRRFDSTLSQRLHL